MSTPQTDTAGGEAADQCTHTVLHLNTGKAKDESCLYVFSPVIDKYTLVGFELVLVQESLVNAGVRFVDMDLTGGYASIENIFKGPDINC